LKKDAAKQILIIDDDVVVNEFLYEFLENEGYFVTSAFNGTEGARMAKKLLPDLIVLDLNLPAGSGESVYDVLKSDEETRGIPVVVATGTSPERVKSLLSKKDIIPSKVFLKPLDIADFLSAVNSILEND